VGGASVKWLRRHLFTSSGAMRPWANVAGFLITVGLLAGFTITYVADQQRKICRLIVLIDDRNQELPASDDPDTRQFRDELHLYRLSLGC
jgi:hypothetical protein